ncbi:MAG TPA: acyl transferase [Cytophagales bacterium]|nr:acyl transferase [Cytophagales bacterium]HAP60570.1 acyl transferase [Cytophagales bacterium]
MEVWKTVRNDTFDTQAMELFRFQAQSIPVYKQYLFHLGVNPEQVQRLAEVPFLPIRFFKEHDIRSYEFQEAAVFESSGTTGQITSKHSVASLDVYHEVCRQGFEATFGKLEESAIFSLLPSYLERSNASLVSMMDHLMNSSGNAFGGFYLDNYASLVQDVNEASRQGIKVILVGVTFALLDLVEQFPQAWPEVVVVETGGMKGRRKEITRAELHRTIKEGLGVQQVYSEYGMTELMSQAYTAGGMYFHAPPWMRVQLRDVNDPLSPAAPSRPGGINVIDLANAHSCAFIETMDIGRVGEGNSFEVLGRFDHSDIRGCNLMTL